MKCFYRAETFPPIKGGDPATTTAGVRTQLHLSRDTTVQLPATDLTSPQSVRPTKLATATRLEAATTAMPATPVATTSTSVPKGTAAVAATRPEDQQTHQASFIFKHCFASSTP